MSRLVIVVPVGRRACGRAVLVGNDGRIRLAPFRVLATASAPAAARHGNPERDWRRPFGDTPAGSYVVTGTLPPSASRTSGEALGAIVITPTAGDAHEASRSGRTRFLVHGGDPDASGRLRPTFGGLRVSNPDLAMLLRAVGEGDAGADPLSSVEVEETSTPLWIDASPEPAPAPVRSTRPASGAAAACAPVPRGVLAALGFGARGRRAAPPGRRAFVTLAELALSTLGSAGAAPEGVGDGGGSGGDGGDDGGGAGAGYEGGCADGGSGPHPGTRGGRRAPPRQDLFVLELLGGMRGGFFLDSGASDGVRKSNTRLLEASFGWTGICVEPNERFFAALVKNRACHCVSCCLYDRDGDVDFLEADVLSGIAGEHHPSLIQLAKDLFRVPVDVGGRPTTVRRPARTVRSVLREHGAPQVFDYWSLDTEGSELAILKSFPFDEYAFRVLTVEHNNLPVRADILRFLQGKGYARVAEMGIDDCYVKEGALRRVE